MTIQKLFRVGKCVLSIMLRVGQKEKTNSAMTFY